MSDQARVSHPISNLRPTEIEGLDSMAELALDLRWSWNHATDEVCARLIPNCGSLETPRPSRRRSRATVPRLRGAGIPRNRARTKAQRGE